ncbi:MAG: sialate O-acetylesterase [Rubripirellula sp.]
MESQRQTDAPATPTTLRLAGMFTDRMVFQRECDAAVWGTAQPRATVTVSPSWSKKSFRAKADNRGKWQTKIRTPNAGGPFQVKVSSGDDSITLSDVLVGEVWICSGQSNMQWKLRGFGIDHFKEDVDKAKYPNIRFCSIPQALALEEQDDVHASWTRCTPKSALAFSAVGYFFGARLHQELDIPIGLISTNWGGSSGEAWVSSEALATEHPEFNETISNYKTLADQSGVLYPNIKEAPKGLRQTSPTVLFNSMVHPLIPFSFRGVIWYQGESNVTKPEQYQSLFPTVIRDWRERWHIGDFPFYFVQIAPFAYKQNPVSAAFLREAQMMTLSEPNTGMVVTMDIGNPTNIHPKQKKPVGERLALLALKRDYGQSEIVDSGPLYSGHSIDGATVRLTFTNRGSGLISRDKKPLSNFTIAGSDKAFVAAEANIVGDAIVVHSDQVPHPVAVRFAWGSADTPNLTNEEGLPASSFRTDHWPVE